MVRSPDTSRISFGAAAVAGAVMLATLPGLGIKDAHALPVGACGTPAIVSQHLKAEGHIVISAMNRMGADFKKAEQMIAAGETPKVDVEYVAQMVTAKRDQSEWYVITANKPLGEEAGRMCVTLAGRSLEINDHRLDAAPFVNTPTYDRDEALDRCDELKAEFGDALTCNERSDMLEKARTLSNHRLALQGTRIGRDDEDGGLVTFVAEPDGDHEYRVLLTTDEGATVVTARGVDFSTSEPVLAVVNARRPQASVTGRAPQLAQK